MRTLVIGLVGALVLTGVAEARLVTKTVEYRQGSVVLEGYLAYDSRAAGRRPGVLVVHEWTGLGPYVRRRVEQLARLGYVAFGADVYGKGVRPATPEAAGAEAGKYKADRALLRLRVRAGLDALAAAPGVDRTRLAAIGYCFGGTAVLELARSGADVAGVVSFHGGLATPTPGDARAIRAKVLALTGADDPHVPAAERAAFEDELRRAGVDWQHVLYGGAVHSFTNEGAGSDASRGAAYDERADRRSWEAMRGFLREVLGRAAPPARPRR